MLNKLISEFPPELLLMLASADRDIVTTKKILHQNQSVNWDRFLQLADHHRVYPLVYATLNKLNKPVVPEHVLVLLRKKCQWNTMHALSVTGETVRMVKCLENHNIGPVVLKGAPLAWRLYGDIAIRPFNDIDILVPKGELEQAIEVLEKEGYQRIYSEPNLTPRQLKVYLKANSHSSHFEYWNAKNSILLEIHWKLSKYGHVLPFPADGTIEKIRVAGSLLPVLSDDEWLLYLIVHGAGHGWRRLRWLLDIKNFIQQENIDWLNLDWLANKFGVQIFLHQTLLLLNKMFGVPVPPDLESVMANDKKAWRLAYLVIAMKSCLLDADAQVKGIKWLYSLFLLNPYGFYTGKGLKNKLYIVSKIFAPKVEDIKLITLPDNLYPLYYVIRPFTSIGRRLRMLFR